MKVVDLVVKMALSLVEQLDGNSVDDLVGCSVDKMELG